MEIKSLTGLRGVAAWLIVLFHFREHLPISNHGPVGKFLDFGYLAVDLFFILSGFVIYLNYRNAVSPATRSGLVAFYGRRLARIYPLHLFVLLIYLLNPLAILLFSEQGDPGGRYDAMYFFYSLLLIQNWGFSPNLAWNVPAWSISVEFAAYLIFPLLVLALGWLSRFGVKIVLAALLGLFVALPLVYLGSDSLSLGANIGSLGLVRCLIQFFMGCVIGYMYFLDESKLLESGPYLILICTAIVLILYFSGARSDYFYAPVVFFALVVYLLEPSRWLARLLSLPILHYLGLISYSTYMIHYFIRDWINFLSSYLASWSFFTYIALTFISSMILYQFVELKGRRFFAARWGRIF